MAIELLKSKLILPPLLPGLVARPRLLHLLDQGLVTKLTLVSAPAGYGKTTLLSAWAHQHTLPVAWVALDESDNDLARFRSYLQAALQQISASFGTGDLTRMEPSALANPLGADNLSAFQTAFLNRLSSLPGDCVLILDDFHLILHQPIQQLIASLLDHLPPQMHLMIASRADPSLPLARLRARGQLVEIRLAQLRFSLEEVALFLEQSGGLKLAGAEIAALASRTEGWVAGLQLASLSMQGRTDLAQYIQDFTGSNRYILDYLMEEVLDRQGATIQDFLLKTSILDRMCGPLCDAVLERQKAKGKKQKDRADDVELLPFTFYLLPSQQVLESLERANVFVIRLDDQRQWYRYHQLFADLLRKRLHQTQAEQVPSLHRRASRWLEQHGMVAEAVDHAFQAGETERAEDLIEQSAEALLARGEVSTLLGWIGRLEAGRVRERPRLDLYRVAALVLLGQDEEAIEIGLNRLALRSDLALETDVLRAYLAAVANRLPAAAQLARQALGGLPENAAFFRSVAGWLLSGAQAGTSDLSQIAELLDGMIRNARALDNRMAWTNALCSLADVRFRQAHLPLAQDLFQEARHVATAADGSLLPIAGEALIGLGHVLREWNELDQAARYLEEGIALIRQAREIGALEGLIGLSLCRQAQGDAIGARWALAQAQRSAMSGDTAGIYGQLVDFYEALLLHKQGDRQAIPRYFGKRPQRPTTDATPLDTQLRMLEQVAWARGCLANQKTAEALATLERLLPEVEQQGWTMLVIESELVSALALDVQGKRNEAQSAFEHALAAAEPGGPVRVFIDEGSAIVALLQAAIGRGICTEYATGLLAALPQRLEARDLRPGDAIPASSPKPQASTLVEPLSLRELEVLGLLARRLSAKEIAGQLSVAESTVHSHIKSIFGKLGVHGRLEAIQKATSLGLIEIPK
jgi:LuxR family maltose regulon positive regulatory protein